MKQLIFAFISGCIFALGLWLSDMVNPQRVRGFLDIFGSWDPALMFVMGSALAVTIPGFMLLKNKNRSLCDTPLRFPTNTSIDPKLIGGSILFGIGWGLVGLCPGPAISVLPVAYADMGFFFVALVVGVLAGNRITAKF